MSDRLITAPADSMTGKEFLDALFGPPRMSRDEAWERSQAWRECEEAMRKRVGGYSEQKAHDDECRARYTQRLDEIAAKYQLTECRGDPFLKRDAA
jgi:hypothetical protein